MLPGRLSVSRTFGDAEAKLSKQGGNPNVVISTPEIKSFRITKDHDFIVMGCDGIFDKLSNKETIQCVWNSVRDNKTMNFANNVHKQSGMGVEYILKNSLLRRTLDNVTVVMISFSNFKHAVFGSHSQRQKPDLPNEKLHNNENSKQLGFEQQTLDSQNSTAQTTHHSQGSARQNDKKIKENIPPSFLSPEFQAEHPVDENAQTAKLFQEKSPF